MDVPRPTENALAQPTRSRIFALLVDRREACRTEEVATALGLHPNGVRRHLERLRDAGLVERTRPGGARGRPADHWVVAQGARPGGADPTGYNELSRWLVRALAGRGGNLGEVERAGREIGRDLAPGGGGDAVARFQQALTALGFQPVVDPRRGGGFKCTLCNCPFRDSVRESADVVCALHRGITEGLLAELDPEAELKRFEPQDPDLAGCLIEVERR